MQNTIYNKIIIKYGELWLKAKNRHEFIKKLARNIFQKTKIKPLIKFYEMEMDYDEEVFEKLLTVPGIQFLAKALVINSDLESIMQRSLDYIKFFIKKNDSFKVNVKRRDKLFPLSSNEIKIKLGFNILKHLPSQKVIMKNPDLTLNIAIEKDQTYLYHQKYSGLGGFPQKTNSRALHLISGGFDSPIAAMKLMKKGVEVLLLNFISPPHTDEKTIIKIDAIINKLTNFQYKINLIQINFTKILNLLNLIKDQRYKINLMRRSFYRIASKLAQKFNCLIISNGESIGQVASQTIESIASIQEVTNIPIFRPLLTYDKTQIIAQAIKHDFYDLIAQKSKETCELFAPKNPIIKPKVAFSKKLEEEISPFLNDLENEIVNQEIVFKKYQYQ